MDSGKQKDKPPNPSAVANVFSQLTFWWTLGIFWKGYKRDLEVEDLFHPLPEHRSDYLGDKFEKLWEDELENTKKLKRGPSLLRVIIKCFGVPLLLYGLLLAFVELFIRVTQPLFVGYLIAGFFDPRETAASKETVYLYAFGVILCSAINVFFIHPYMMAIFHIGMKMRVACCSLIYRKSLRLSKSALGQTTVGQVVNLLSNDVNRFDVAVIFLHYLWVGPLETLVITYFMWGQVGVSSVIGVIIMLLFIPFQAFLGKKTSALRLKTAIKSDERVRLMNEIISGIRVIKMYTWEMPFAKLVHKSRKDEIACISDTSYIKGFLLSFIVFTTRISIFATVLSYSLLGNNITAEKVFILTSFYNILRQTMTVFFPQGIALLAEALVSTGRLKNFMLHDEVELSSGISKCNQTNLNDKSFKTVSDNMEINMINNPKKHEENNYKKDYSEVTKKEQRNKNDSNIDTTKNLKIDKNDDGGNNNTTDENLKENDICVKLENAVAKWLFESSEPTLNDINFTVNCKQLVAVIGLVGASKTSLLHAILQELPLQKGSLTVNGKISYASQEPWLFAASVRQNILFGQPYDKDRYREVVKVCALRRDFQLLPHGDKTMVGERGISLSGGQRARINLARAVYMDADIYLLDDPLSAVDTHVGKHLFDDCISGYLKDKAVVLITHQLQYLQGADKIVIMNGGKIEEQGTYKSLVEIGLNLHKLIEGGETEDYITEDEHPLNPLMRQISYSSISSVSVCADDQKEQVLDSEMKTVGTVSGDVYAAYFRAGGNYFIISLVMFLFILTQAFANGGDWWITNWVNIEETMSRNETDVTQVKNIYLMSRDTCIYVYTGITVATIVISLVRSFMFFFVCMRASINLHNTMFNSVTRATMWFFNNNTSGRILNRFSKDMGAVDELLPQAMVDCLQIGLAMTGVIVVVAVVNFWLIIPTIFVGIIFYLLRVFYIATSRSVKRLEGITRSPVFSHLNASLQGLTTIRAFQAQHILEKEFDNHQDLHSSAWYLFIASSRAFGFWLDLVCVIYIAVVTLSFLVLGGETFGGNVGLAITQAIGLTGMFQWGMRQSAEVENLMTSVERVLEYTRIEQEPELESDKEKKPPEDWPSEGAIHFEDLSLKYSKTEPSVLKNLNIYIQPSEKIGIVGRTGAGKSSLITALFRLAELEGKIYIDDIDITTIGLHDLRKKLSIIPQEPVLFSGMMRKNLDPFDEYSDEVLWQALEEVELKDVVNDLAAGLYSKISEGGSNFSVGQRQLLCLARAIVRKNKILILDEATANVDPQTDGLIQKTIRRKFKECTVLTVAHRLHTIMDSDKVLVMDAGECVEFGHPFELLKDKKGYFSKMVQQTGRSMESTLFNIAKESYSRIEQTDPTSEDSLHRDS